MKKLSKLALVLAASMLSVNLAHASSQPTTFVGPTLKAGYTRNINDYSAYSLLGEAGVKNFRAGGTLGWKLEENQYLKVSAEYLWQNINYHFFSGNTMRWVQQGALGAGYLYEFLGYNYEPHIDVNAYVSHAPSRSIGTRNGFVTYQNSTGGFDSFRNSRRIAGSNAAGIVPAVSVAPWNGARVGLGLNYDNVRYDNTLGPNRDAKGFGGTLTYNQVITPDIGFGLMAGVRKPFNTYSADVQFANVPYMGNWVVGLDGDYTVGKETLPNTWNLAVTANYAFDDRVAPAPMYKDSGKNFKDKMYKDMMPVKDDLIAYTADPAVYMPQVLAIPDEYVQIPSCTDVPGLSGVPIPPMPVVSAGTSESTDASVAFSGSGLTYSVSTTGLVLGQTVTINPTTGVLTATYPGGSTSNTATATVTATNACGRASASTTIIFLGTPG
jgi:hypothetical protein